MSTFVEIEAALPKLTDDELVRLDRILRRLYRNRHNRELYDDSYGLYTEADLISSAEEAFLAYDREEEENAKRQAR